MSKPTVCLCMIVKNEVDVLTECLNSVKPLIDHWIIADTGSSDGTQGLIETVMDGVPGELLERPWRNFGHNRSEVIQAAGHRFDYLLMIDADETLDYTSDFRWPDLVHDAYLITKSRGRRRYRLPSLVKASLNWRFKGVLHEHIETDADSHSAPLDGVTILSDRRGARSRDPHTYKKDALMLEGALLDEPDNARYVYYLAQSYRDCEDYDLAIRHYQHRSTMGGWSEEVFNALYQIGHCKKWRGDPRIEVIDAFLKAHQARPTRAEPLYAIARHLVDDKEHATALVFLERARQIPLPINDILFVEAEVYAFHAEILTGVCYYYLGRYEKANDINHKLLTKDDLPPEVEKRIKANIHHSFRQMGLAKK